jgi:hypothetical protein
MYEDGSGKTSSSHASDLRFAEVYNDLATYPFLADVAYELDISYQTVRNKAAVLRGRKRHGEDVPDLISRVGVKAPGKEKEFVDPIVHANARADHLREQLHDLLTSSRYPVTNPEAVMVEGTLNDRYNRTSGSREKTEGVPRTWLTDKLRGEGVEDPRGRKFLFTGAQNDCPVDPDFWLNLQAYAEYLDADIVIGPGTYETQWWAENNPAVRSYAPEIQEFLCFGQMEIGNEFVFAGEMNMLPTANRPVSDLANYSAGKWTVFPHAKRQLQSIASLDPHKQAHQIMTTGLVTRPKIIPRKAGIKSLAYHTIGATIVEFDQDGDLFCRQITAGPNGAFYDLEYFVSDGVVDLHDGVDLIVAADWHLRKFHKENSKAVLHRSTGMIAVLQAKELAVHDIFDNETRNHHHVHDNAHSYEMAIRGRESVFSEISDVAEFLAEVSQAVKVTVVEANHDIALERYVREGRYRNDGINIRLGLQLEDAYLEARERQANQLDSGEPVDSFSLLEYAVRTIGDRADLDLGNVNWVHDGYSYTVNGVEVGNHGFRGANGARGTMAGFAALGRKMTIGDKHTPGILDDVFCVGAMNLRHGYNKGPSGWAVTQGVHYPDGNRTLVTFQNSKWRG